MASQIPVEVVHDRHVERMWLDVCNLERMEIILGMPWLAVHNPEIDWEKGEVRMIRCSLVCDKREKVRKILEQKEVVRRRETR